MQRTVLMFLAVFGLPALARAQAAAEPLPTPIPRVVEPRADAELKRMSDFLSKLKAFAYEAEETFDEIPDGELRQQLTNLRRVAVERPNHVASDATGDTLNRAAWYDGKTVTVLDKEHNNYATAEMPATIDATIDLLQDEYDVVLPLSDFVYSNPYARLSEGVTYGRYLGIHQAASVPCHHLAFSTDTIEWQIWIDAGTQPLPRKLVITYVNEASEPQYTAVFRRWKIDGPVPPGLFTFEAPEGAVKIDSKAMRKRMQETTPKPSGVGGGR
jgi:hypothetical protein